MCHLHTRHCAYSPAHLCPPLTAWSEGPTYTNEQGLNMLWMGGSQYSNFCPAACPSGYTCNNVLPDSQNYNLFLNTQCLVGGSHCFAAFTAWHQPCLSPLFTAASLQQLWVVVRLPALCSSQADHC